MDMEPSLIDLRNETNPTFPIGRLKKFYGMTFEQNWGADGLRIFEVVRRIHFYQLEASCRPNSILVSIIVAVDYLEPYPLKILRPMVEEPHMDECSPTVVPNCGTDARLAFPQGIHPATS